MVFKKVLFVAIGCFTVVEAIRPDARAGGALVEESSTPQALEEKTHLAAFPGVCEAAGFNVIEANSSTVKLQGLHLIHVGTQCKVTDAGLDAISKALPQTLTTFTLNVANACREVTDACGGNGKLTDASLDAVSKALPSTLTKLELWLQSTQVADPGVEALAQRLPQTLTTFTLGLQQTKVGDAGLIAIANRLPVLPKTLWLLLWLRETQVTQEAIDNIKNYEDIAGCKVDIVTW